ncbi:hypothetical protein COOONC_28001 [Cooperia oncophora]
MPGEGRADALRAHIARPHANIADEMGGASIPLLRRPGQMVATAIRSLILSSGHCLSRSNPYYFNRDELRKEVAIIYKESCRQ